MAATVAESIGQIEEYVDQQILLARTFDSIEAIAFGFADYVEA